MRAPSAAELVDIWEAGQGQPPYRRALLLLAAACPELAVDALADLPIGRRDGLLLTLRERLFGAQLTGVASCPRCAERLELAFAASDIRAAAPPDGPLDLELAGYRVRFRLPTSRDLAALAGPDAGRALLARCVSDAQRGEAPCVAEELPADVTTAIAARMAAADPQADVQLGLSCPACGQAWQAPFDIVSYLWGELESWAARALREVHSLARAYGWREADILALSEYRRQYYLSLALGL